MGLGVGSGYTWVTTELSSRENRRDLRQEYTRARGRGGEPTRGWRMSSGFEKQCGQLRKELREA